MCDSPLCPIGYGDLDCCYYQKNECQHRFYDLDLEELKSFLEMAKTQYIINKVEHRLLLDLMGQTITDE